MLYTLRPFTWAYHRLKILNLLSPHGFFQAQNTPKPVFGAGGAYDAPQTP